MWIAHDTPFASHKKVMTTGIVELSPNKCACASVWSTIWLLAHEQIRQNTLAI